MGVRGYTGAGCAVMLSCFGRCAAIQSLLDRLHVHSDCSQMANLPDITYILSDEHGDQEFRIECVRRHRSAPRSGHTLARAAPSSTW